jgi:hypothetical protein
LLTAVMFLPSCVYPRMPERVWMHSCQSGNRNGRVDNRWIFRSQELYGMDVVNMFDNDQLC